MSWLWDGRVEDPVIWSGTKEIPSVAVSNACFSNMPKKMPKSVGARKQPCLTPLRISSGSEELPLNSTVPFVSVWTDSIMLCNLGGQPIFGRTLKGRLCWPDQTPLCPYRYRKWGVESVLGSQSLRITPLKFRDIFSLSIRVFKLILTIQKMLVLKFTMLLTLNIYRNTSKMCTQNNS